MCSKWEHNLLELNSENLKLIYYYTLDMSATLERRTSEETYIDRSSKYACKLQILPTQSLLEE